MGDGLCMCILGCRVRNVILVDAHMLPACAEALEEWLRKCGIDMAHDDKPHSQLNKIKDQFTKMEQCR